MYPVTQPTPAKAPTQIVSSVTMTISGITAINIRQVPAATMASPNRRLRLKSPSSFGPPNMPPARPMNTAPNNTPYAALPPPRLVVNCLPVAMIVPPEANAPRMPMIRPRTSGVRRTKVQPSTIERPRPVSPTASPALVVPRLRPISRSR